MDRQSPDVQNTSIIKLEMATASPGRTASKQGAKEMPDKVDENNAKIVAFSLLLLVLLGHGVNYLLYGKFGHIPFVSL